MIPKTKQMILMFGTDTSLGYLLGRFAEHSQYELMRAPEQMSIQEISVANPAAIIFQSTDFLGQAQPLVFELTNLDVPIIVCSSVTEEVRARELGADFCLLHPITYDGFQAALANTGELKR